MPTDPPLPDADTFKQMKRAIHRALMRAIESVALWVYYPNVDLTIQIRGGKCRRLDWREIDEMKA